MQIDEVHLQFVSLPLKSPFATSFGMERTKNAWLLTVRGEGVEGYGESVASDAPLYSEETHASVYYALRDHLIPRLAGEIVTPRDVSERLAPVRGNRMAKAAVEMAVWDWFARAQGVPLRKLLGGDMAVAEVPVGVSIGIQDTTQALCTVAENYWQQGYRRLKVKIRPGWDWVPLQALRDHLGRDVPIMADANSAYRLADIDLLASFDALDLMMIEQPLGYDDYIDHAVLARRIQTPVCLDESVHSAEDARKALELGACRIINMKVGRVGGYGPALDIHAQALAAHVPLWCGGMLETGIGRAHNVQLTTLQGFTMPGDTSASDRYFDEDIVAEPFVLTPAGTLKVPAGPGIGVVPDPDRVRRACCYQETWRLARGQRGSLGTVQAVGKSPMRRSATQQGEGGFPFDDLG